MNLIRELFTRCASPTLSGDVARVQLLLAVLIFAQFVSWATGSRRGKDNG